MKNIFPRWFRTCMLYAFILLVFAVFASIAVAQPAHHQGGLSELDDIHYILGIFATGFGGLWAFANRQYKMRIKEKDESHDEIVGKLEERIESLKKSSDEKDAKITNLHAEKNNLYERSFNAINKKWDNTPILNGEGARVIENSKNNNRMLGEIHAHMFSGQQFQPGQRFFSGLVESDPYEDDTPKPNRVPKKGVVTINRVSKRKKVYRKQAIQDPGFDALSDQVRYDRDGKPFKYADTP